MTAAGYCCGRKGTAICWLHAAPVASWPVNVIVTVDGTAMFPAFKFAEREPCAGSVALPKNCAIELAKLTPSKVNPVTVVGTAAVSLSVTAKENVAPFPAAF